MLIKTLSAISSSKISYNTYLSIVAEKSIIKLVKLRDNYMTKNLGGRPEIELTEKQIKEVEEKAESLTCEQIADYFGISHVTFIEIRKRQPEVSLAYKRGRAKAIDDIASSLIKNAKAGDTTSQVFFLKTQAGWRETQSIETKDTTPSKQLPQINIHVNDKPEHRLED